MSVAAGRPPYLSNQQALTMIKKHFNFKEVHEASIKEFPSYRDRNYYFHGECIDESSLREFVFKQSNPLSTTFEVMEGVNAVMKHLHSRSHKTPYPLASQMGNELIELSRSELLDDTPSNEDDQCMKYPVYVLSFIPGEIFDHVDKSLLTPKLLSEIGDLLGKMDKELMNNFSSKALAARKNPDWDLMHFLAMKKYLQHLDDSTQISNGEKIFKAFEEHVSPKIPSFKKGIIHGDMNGLNIVLKTQHSAEGDAYNVAGFIDFNDSIKTCVIFELGISLAYIMQENLHPVHCSNAVEFVGPLISAYNNILPLSAEELDCLYYLVLARCCQTALNGIRSHKVEPWNSYLLTTPKKSWVLVDKLLSIPKSEVDGIWKNYINKT